MSELVTVTIENHIADIRLNRPEKMNALNPQLIDSLISTAAKVSALSGVRCVVLSGEGDAFCAGLDFTSFDALKDSGRQEILDRKYGITNKFQQLAWAWRECPVPVISALHGVVYGGGLQIALGCDIRVIHPEASLSIMEIKWGLIPDMCGSVFLPNLVSDDIVRELTYTGRIFSGVEAKDYGFVTRLAQDPFQTAMSIATEIASKSPDAVRAAKAMFNNAVDDRAKELLLKESELQAQLSVSSNHQEAVRANLEKRAPVFEDSGLKI